MENQHGLPQLVHDGYVFRCDRERPRHSYNDRGEDVLKVRTYWRCILRSCRARGSIDPAGRLRVSHEHSHLPTEESVKYRNLRTEIRKRCLQNKHETPKEILEHFKISDKSLEKTIVNWRYRFTKEPKESELISSLRKKVDQSNDPPIKKEEMILQEGEEVLLEEDDYQVGMYQIAEEEDETGQRRIFYILQQ